MSSMNRIDNSIAVRSVRTIMLCILAWFGLSIITSSAVLAQPQLQPPSSALASSSSPASSSPSTIPSQRSIQTGSFANTTADATDTTENPDDPGLAKIKADFFARHSTATEQQTTNQVAASQTTAASSTATNQTSAAATNTATTNTAAVSETQAQAQSHQVLMPPQPYEPLYKKSLWEKLKEPPRNVRPVVPTTAVTQTPTAATAAAAPTGSTQDSASFGTDATTASLDNAQQIPQQQTSRQNIYR